jgi:RNA polymerase primary sigma factor
VFRDPQESAAELALVDRAKRGGPREREELVDAFLPMIVSAAHAYRRATRIDQHELTQEGIVGLLRALERFDPERGVPFWAYASWWVRQAMQQLVSELSRPIVLSDRALRRLARIKDAQRRFEQIHHRSPRSAEVAQIVGLPRSQVESLLCTERTARGLDERLGGEPCDRTTVHELLADPRACEAYERVPERLLAAELPGLLEHLTARERTVVCSRYGIGGRERMLREVAPLLGVTAERVRQIEEESLAKLRAAV